MPGIFFCDTHCRISSACCRPDVNVVRASSVQRHVSPAPVSTITRTTHAAQHQTSSQLPPSVTAYRRASYSGASISPNYRTTHFALTSSRHTTPDRLPVHWHFIHLRRVHSDITGTRKALGERRPPPDSTQLVRRK